MLIKNSKYYITKRDWFEDVIDEENVILCLNSALECLQLFPGFLNEDTINVYARKIGKYSNINYHIRTDLDSIDTVKIGDLYCTSLSQTVNDILADIENLDEQPLVEALNYYYFTHNESFDGLNILPENKEKLDEMKEWIIEY